MCSVPGTGDIGSGRVTDIRKIKGDVWAPGEEVREFLTALRGTCRPRQSSWPEKQQAQRRWGGGKGVMSPPENELKRRCEGILLCTALPRSWHEHVPGQQVHLANQG